MNKIGGKIMWKMSVYHIELFAKTPAKAATTQEAHMHHTCGHSMCNVYTISMMNQRKHFFSFFPTSWILVADCRLSSLMEKKTFDQTNAWQMTYMPFDLMQKIQPDQAFFFARERQMYGIEMKLAHLMNLTLARVQTVFIQSSVMWSSQGYLSILKLMVEWTNAWPIKLTNEQMNEPTSTSSPMNI